ncbi:MAG: AAA family ATPase [Gammaproteobacteria bacterium]|nr:AAA family ATPase [Gammaproteobacteria bacterium]MBU1725319.1 AAA family ATPase [Gammaproteobacteria bacterium]MBU2004328.1 AAA family ATPase [Gammaproteobacteria bacterium]
MEQILTDHNANIEALTFNGGSQLASGSGEGRVKLWDMQTGELKQTLKAGSELLSMSFNREGQLVTGGGDGTVEFWDIQTGKLKHGIITDGRASSIAFDGGTIIASGSFDGGVKLWDAQTSELKHTLPAHTDWVKSVMFDGDGQLASVSNDGTVKLWDAQTGELKHTLLAQSHVTSVVFDDGGQLVGGSSDGTVKLWDKTSRQKEEATRVLLAGNRGLWMTVDAAGQVEVADDGSLLRKGILLDKGEINIKVKRTDYSAKEPVDKLVNEQVSYTITRWEYLSTLRNNNTSWFVQPEQNTLNMSVGKANLFTLILSNTGTEPVHHPQIVTNIISADGLQIIPAEPQPTFPQTEAIFSRSSLIPSGGSIRLAARVITSGSSPPSSGTYALPVTVKAGGQTKQVTLTVNVKTPNLSVTGSDFSSDSNTLSIRLKNEGLAELPKSHFYLVDEEGKTLQSPLQALQSIPAQTDALPLAFTLPDGISREQRDRLKLEVRPMRPPLYTQWLIPLEINAMPAHLQILLALASLVLLGFTIFYFRRYRHPLVLELGAHPENLLQQPLETLPEAQHRLSQTQRLNSVLEYNSVTRQRLQTAITFNQALPQQQVKVLAKRLHASLQYPDPQLVWLQLADDFPLDVKDLLLFQPDPTLAVDDVPDAVRHLLQAAPHLEKPLCLLLGADADYRNRLLRVSEDYSNPLVTLTSRDLTRLLLDAKPQDVLARIIAEQVSLDQISPYQISQGVERETVFFGRRSLITRIMNRAPANYLLVGARQLGKSSLLKALERRYRRQPEVQCHYLVLKSENLQADLGKVLQLSMQTPLDELLGELRQRIQQQRYVFLIDEADDFIRAERQNDYALLKELRSLSETGQCNFILAGFWQLYDYAVLDYQSPLKNFGEILHLGELEEDACRQLATVPMAMMNLRYAAPVLIDELVQTTGQRPNLIATACHVIINNLPHGQHEITAGDLHNALTSDEVEGRLAGWDGSLPDDKAAQKLDRIVVYTGIQLDSFTFGDMLAALEAHGFTPEADDLQRSLKRLELGFVLGREKQRYYFRIPLFKQMIAEDEPEIRLQAELR